MQRNRHRTTTSTTITTTTTTTSITQWVGFFRYIPATRTKAASIHTRHLRGGTCLDVCIRSGEMRASGACRHHNGQEVTDCHGAPVHHSPARQRRQSYIVVRHPGIGWFPVAWQRAQPNPTQPSPAPHAAIRAKHTSLVSSQVGGIDGILTDKQGPYPILLPLCTPR